jgi:hypothetical protein
MTMFDPKDWLESGRAAVVDGLALRPQPHSCSARLVLSMSKGQAAVYYLRDDHQGEWMLKKFHTGRAPDAANVLAVQSLVPRDKGFEAAYLRRCLRRDMASRTGYSPTEFIDWIDGTVLMPRVMAADWSEVLGNMRDGGTDLSLGDRVTLAENLCTRVEVLEEAQLAHRDLSATNVMVDASLGIHLIDWDSLYAPSLQMPANTTVITNGYAAPFIRDRNEDPAATWTAGGDRFAMAVLVLEAFAADSGCAFTGDGGLLDQAEINARGGAGIGRALDAAARCTNFVEPLFMRALCARTALDCPSPREWQQSLRQVVAARRRAQGKPAEGHFVQLDMSVFVQLDHSRFAILSRWGNA